MAVRKISLVRNMTQFFVASARHHKDRVLKPYFHPSMLNDEDLNFGIQTGIENHRSKTLTAATKQSI
ncbi:hypothetical protein U062_02143 [Gammaproteobacteria bacterium MOLA455]|nr:hypothetical protein U062_02143 [Gammaproteobacteria bacterium MOLA455]